MKSTPGKGIFWKNEHQNIEAYTDADWAGSVMIDNLPLVIVHMYGVISLLEKAKKCML